MSKELNEKGVVAGIPTTAMELSTPKGLVKVGDTVVALGNKYKVNEVQADMMISLKPNGEKIAIAPSLVEEIVRKEE